MQGNYGYRKVGINARLHLCSFPDVAMWEVTRRPQTRLTGKVTGTVKTSITATFMSTGGRFGKFQPEPKSVLVHTQPSIISWPRNLRGRRVDRGTSMGRGRRGNRRTMWQTHPKSSWSSNPTSPAFKRWAKSRARSSPVGSAPWSRPLKGSLLCAWHNCIFFSLYPNVSKSLCNASRSRTVRIVTIRFQCIAETVYIPIPSLLRPSG